MISTAPRYHQLCGRSYKTTNERKLRNIVTRGNGNLKVGGNNDHNFMKFRVISCCLVTLEDILHHSASRPIPPPKNESKKYFDDMENGFDDCELLRSNR